MDNGGILTVERLKNMRFVINQYLCVTRMDDNPVCFGRTLDVSKEGLSGIFDKELLCNTHYKLIFNIKRRENNSIVGLSGSVMYCSFDSELDGYKAGFKF